MALLLEREAAERLRIAWRTVRALRLSGQLPYLPGRPIRIDERDLDAYIEKLRGRLEAKRPAQPAPSRQGPAAFEAAARTRAAKRILGRAKT